MTRDEKRPLPAKMKRTGRPSADREIGTAYWCAGALFLAYLTAVCALRGYSFAMVAIGAAAVGIGALVSMIAARLYD